MRIKTRGGLGLVLLNVCIQLYVAYFYHLNLSATCPGAGNPTLNYLQTHTHTPCPPLIIGSSQRIVASEARHVEVVFNDHDVSHFEVLIKASGCVGQHHRLHAEQLEDAYGQCNLGTQHGI